MRKINGPLTAGWRFLFPTLATCMGTLFCLPFKGRFAQHETRREKDCLTILTISSSKVQVNRGEGRLEGHHPLPRCPRQTRMRVFKDSVP